jgi:hypothetical protein
MGGYTDVTPHSIRAEALDCPVGAPTAVCPGGGYTYADFGKVSPSGPEPHYDGEIWAETMWDLRNALGPALAVRLAARAFRDVPNQPSFLDMRNAILRADPTGSATIWRVFAHRGMGCDASTSGSDDTAPHAGFNVPPCPLPAPSPTPAPTVQGQPTVSPTPAPSATPTPPPSPPRKPSFTLRRSGRRGVAFMVTCHAACSVTGTLRVSRSVARKLHLGSRRVVGKLRAQLKAAGRRTYTVRLDSAAKRGLKRARKLKTFKATLTAQAGYSGAAPASARRTVTIRR